MPKARQITLSSPFGDAIEFRRMVAREELGRLFEYNLDLLSDDEQLAFEDILGQSVTVSLKLRKGETRYFNGYVTRFRQAGRLGRNVLYHATLRPWLWFLTRSSDCRIFQGKTVPDILKEIFREYGFSDFEEILLPSYRTWDYCVQYRETDFNFVSRLMEQEGLYYYFKHDDGKHTLVLADSYGSHDLIPGYEKIPYFPPSENVIREEHISDWAMAQDLQPGVYALNDFDFTKPDVKLEVKSSAAPRKHARADYEIYDYPGEYEETTPDGEGYAKIRSEELEAQFERLEGQGNARGLTVGGLFELEGYPRGDQNREYLVVSAVHQLEEPEYETGVGETGPAYSCRFTAIYSQQSYRSPRITPKPIVQGPQTAIVVGKAGEEIWTDKHGRVKVLFHWDRHGKKDENASCWIRVSHPWAGKNWGAVAIPRIGQEVIVDFLEGDPDRPIITGRVYNAIEMPPYGLPAGAVVSGIKSNSTKGGGGYNEYVMDDTKGNELIREHGQYDKDSTIEHDLREHVLNNRSRDVAVDETISIGNNRTKTVGVDQSETIGSNKSIQVGANHTEAIGANMTLTVGRNKTETVAINTAETIGVAKELTIGAAYQVTVGAAMNETIGAAKAEEIGAVKSVNVGASSSENVGTNKSVDAGGNISEAAGKNVSITAGKDFSVKAGAKGIIDIADQLTIKCGDASITLKKDGTISISGKDISVKGSGKINVKASSDVVIKGSKVGIN